MHFILHISDTMEEELQRQNEQELELSRIEQMQRLSAAVRERLKTPVLPYLWEASGAPGCK